MKLLPRLQSNPFEYRRNLPHYQKAEHPHFVTFNAYPGTLLLPAALDIALSACLHFHGTRIRLHAAVIMPEHVHFIATPLWDKNGDLIPLQKVMHSIKSYSAHQINKLLNRTGPVWQDESFDHMLRSHERVEEKIEYIRQNPVERKLVRKPEDYKWLWTDEMDAGCKKK